MSDPTWRSRGLLNTTVPCYRSLVLGEGLQARRVLEDVGFGERSQQGLPGGGAEVLDAGQMRRQAGVGHSPALQLDVH